MKKYIKPVLEVLLIKDIDNVMAAVSPGNWAEGKENNLVFEEVIEEEPDTTSIWNDPWKIDYSLWDE